jgi:hypothetical protein
MVSNITLQNTLHNHLTVHLVSDYDGSMPSESLGSQTKTPIKGASRNFPNIMNAQETFKSLVKFVRTHSVTAICQSDYLYNRYASLFNAYYGQETPVFVTRFPCKDVDTMIAIVTK